MQQEIIITVLIVVFFCGAVIWVIRRKNRSKLTTIESGTAIEVPFRATEGGRLLRDFLAFSFTRSGQSETQREEALAVLRRNANGVVEEIEYMYGASPESAYNARWALVYCAAALNVPQAAKFLYDVANSPLPPERSTDLCHHSTVGEETIIRTRAVEGLKNLTLNLDLAARDALLELLRSASQSIRIGAAQALLQLPEAARRAIEPAMRERLGPQFELAQRLRRPSEDDLARIAAVAARAVASSRKPGSNTPEGSDREPVRRNRNAPRLNRDQGDENGGL